MEGSSLPAASAWASTVRSRKRTSTDGSWIPTLQCVSEASCLTLWEHTSSLTAFCAV